MSFDQIHQAFNNGNNVVKFQSSFPKAIEYLLIRSIDKPQLIEMLEANGQDVSFEKTPKIEELYRRVFLLNLSKDTLSKFILSKYPEIKASRLANESGLEALLENFGNVRCGLRNDRLDTEVQKVVRNKRLRTWEELSSAFDTLAIKARQYAEWSYVNQASTDLIEHFVNNHKNVIPTLRKIPHIDFFYDFKEHGLIPFDLKITNISEEFFDQEEKLAVKSSCQETLKACYKEIKKTEKNLPNLSTFDTTEDLFDFLNTLKVQFPIIEKVFAQVLHTRQTTIQNLHADRKRLEMWNYTNQGPRLFCNNNRFFVFLAHEGSFGDARGLKKKVKTIGSLIDTHLNNLKFESLNQFTYSYDLEAQLKGDYSTISTSVLLSE
ncbi:hypothetical protein [Polynucleobacter sinensis]|uniref:hypothetical protein n=1 Tax=Polynucleobacter sinensis TaxID=1743157 RepID=UPI0007817546|nr:hypothetical protein [Polynucleobacter sinensis]